MTTKAPGRTQVRGLPDDGLSAHCPECGSSLELQQNADVAAALASFDVHHPTAVGRTHSPGLPWGWRASAREVVTDSR